jgi:hypothetical protein
MDGTDMGSEELPKWFPYSIYIAAYHTAPEEKLESQSIVEKLYHKYGGVYSRDLDSLDSRSDSILSYVRGLSEGDSRVLLIAVGSEADKAGFNSIPSYEKYNELIEGLKAVLPRELDSAYTLRAAYATDEEEAEALLRRYEKNARGQLRSAGLIRNCVLATLKGSSTSMPTRELMVLPYGDGENAVGNLWTLCLEVCFLALYNGEMIRLYSERKLMFDQMEASESSTQLRINEILAEMRRPVDEIQPGDLEDILKEITIQFSRLSTLASSMRRDHVKARGLLRGLRNLLKGWNERPIAENLTNTSVETEDFENLMAPFSDFIERTEALMAQLNTVLDSVRTYLGIQQQKASIVEQTSSKEQLVRLVNLQEILHKLEILIVAVYLTEMARIVFETLLQESANLLTTAFIPIALLISILISRILHKTR